MDKRSSKNLPLRIRLLAGLMRRLSWIGLRMELFYTVREGQTAVPPVQTSDSFRCAFVTAEHVEDLARLQPGSDRQESISRFHDGKLCYGVWDKTQLIAAMWCDLDEFNYPPNFRKLAGDEVYLYGAFTDPGYRGRNLAPLMRASGYSALREMGRSRIYSYTDYCNTAAGRFKAKLGARNDALKIHLELFGRWSITSTLRRYL